MKDIKVKIVTTEGLLGTLPANKEVYSTYIAANAPGSKTMEEEIAEYGVDAVAEKGTTVFPRMEDGTPFLYDYQIKGFFKDACGGLARIGGKDDGGKKRYVNESGKLKAYKKLIDTLIFPMPRKIPIRFDGERGTADVCFAGYVEMRGIHGENENRLTVCETVRRQEKDTGKSPIS